MFSLFYRRPSLSAVPVQFPRGKKISFAPGKTGSFSSWCICAFCEEKEEKTRIALSSRAYISKQWVPNGIRRLTSLHLLLLSQTRHVDASHHRTSTQRSIADQRILLLYQGQKVFFTPAALVGMMQNRANTRNTRAAWVKENAWEHTNNASVHYYAFTE